MKKQNVTFLLAFAGECIASNYANPDKKLTLKQKLDIRRPYSDSYSPMHATSNTYRIVAVENHSAISHAPSGAQTTRARPLHAEYILSSAEAYLESATQSYAPITRNIYGWEESSTEEIRNRNFSESTQAPSEEDSYLGEDHYADAQDLIFFSSDVENHTSTTAQASSDAICPIPTHEFWDFFASLGNNGTERYNTLKIISSEWAKETDESQKNIVFEKIANELLEFMQKNGPQHPKYNLCSAQSQCSNHGGKKRTPGDMFVNLDRHKYTLGEIVSQHIRLPNLGWNNCFLNTAIQSLLSIPEVFYDLKHLPIEFVIHVKETIHMPEHTEAFEKASRDYLGKVVHIEPFVHTILSLYEMVQATVNFKKNKISKKCWLETVQEKERCIYQSLNIYHEFSQKRNQNSFWSSPEVYTTLHGFMGMFYKFCELIPNSPVLEGAYALAPDMYFENVFTINSMAAATSDNCYAIKTGEPVHIVSSAPALQHVYYIDNEEKMRKVVIVPNAAGGLLYTQIISHIHKLYQKPIDEIHPFVFNTEKRSWSYRAPKMHVFNNAYDIEKQEVVVFYYIKKSPNSSGFRYLLSEFNTKTAREDLSRVRFPLFLNLLEFSAVSLSGYEYGSNIRIDDNSITFASLDSIKDKAPVRFLIDPEKGIDYYKNLEFSLSASSNNKIDVDLAIANSSCRVFSENSSRMHNAPKTKYHYYTRVMERGRYYNIYFTSTNNISSSIDEVDLEDVNNNCMKTFAINLNNAHYVTKIMENSRNNVQSSMFLINDADDIKWCKKIERREEILDKYQVCEYSIMHPLKCSMENELGIYNEIFKMVLN
ncbi:uncharacterized protein NEMAJ01_0973 [Nematocida major]|uniref:uncharacterized protein n=1 Tax=Nematocida major TaxID=1912982 RepID=UPI0020084C7E|nr:uncharacterized protein NEMAJ01_0973 [Nematocida major]KAH9386077.1 hypothetical protein NEMAJ01_0973 [Nematocida major]